MYTHVLYTTELNTYFIIKFLFDSEAVWCFVISEFSLKVGTRGLALGLGARGLILYDIILFDSAAVWYFVFLAFPLKE